MPQQEYLKHLAPLAWEQLTVVAKFSTPTLKLAILVSNDPNRGNTHEQTFAICVSNDGEKWCWKGVEDWPANFETPPMSMNELVIA